MQKNLKKKRCNITVSLDVYKAIMKKQLAIFEQTQRRPSFNRIVCEAINQYLKREEV